MSETDKNNQNKIIKYEENARQEIEKNTISKMTLIARFLFQSLIQIRQKTLESDSLQLRL
jgi:hypothetical protein